MMEYYTFEINNEKVGYYEQNDKNDIFYAKAYMLIDGEKIENPFWVKHQDGAILEIKFGTQDWTIFDQPENVYPSSATNLLLQELTHQKFFSYQSYSESKGKIVGELILKRNSNRIEEYDGERLIRYFIQKEGIVVEYGWGGEAKSVRVGSLAEATAGTAFE